MVYKYAQKKTELHSVTLCGLPISPASCFPNSESPIPQLTICIINYSKCQTAWAGPQAINLSSEILKALKTKVVSWHIWQPNPEATSNINWEDAFNRIYWSYSVNIYMFCRNRTVFDFRVLPQILRQGSLYNILYILSKLVNFKTHLACRVSDNRLQTCPL